MQIDLDRLLASKLPDVETVYDEKDVIVYAIGVGYGMDPTDDRQLRFVYEPGLQVVPTYASAVGWRSHWVHLLDAELDYHGIVHAEEALHIHAPLPASGHVIGKTRVTDFTDKGKERGAILRLSREIVDAGSQLHYATIDQTIFCRKDGGRGGLPPRVHDTWRPPEGEPDFSIDWPTFPSQGLLYRQNGDRNELHVRNDIARAAGFRQPLFHGLATLGIAVHGVLRSVCDYDPHRVGSVAARFTAPMYPGETVRTQIWRQGNEVRFRVFCVERDTMVLDRGIVRLR